MATPHSKWEADKMLDVYIYDYLCKRNLTLSAKAFLAEAKVSPDPVAINAPGGFLFEWWSVFWDIFIARTNERHSEVAASYIETQQIKARQLKQLQQKLREQQQLAHEDQKGQGLPGLPKSAQAGVAAKGDDQQTADAPQPELSQRSGPAATGATGSGATAALQGGAALGGSASPAGLQQQAALLQQQQAMLQQQQQQRLRQQQQDPQQGLGLPTAGPSTSGATASAQQLQLQRLQQQLQQQRQQQQHQSQAQEELLRGRLGAGAGSPGSLQDAQLLEERLRLQQQMKHDGAQGGGQVQAEQLGQPMGAGAAGAGTGTGLDDVQGALRRQLLLAGGSASAVMAALQQQQQRPSGQQGAGGAQLQELAKSMASPSISQESKAESSRAAAATQQQLQQRQQQLRAAGMLDASNASVATSLLQQQQQRQQQLQQLQQQELKATQQPGASQQGQQQQQQKSSVPLTAAQLFQNPQHLQQFQLLPPLKQRALLLQHQQHLQQQQQQQALLAQEKARLKQQQMGGSSSQAGAGGSAGDGSQDMQGLAGQPFPGKMGEQDDELKAFGGRGEMKAAMAQQEQIGMGNRFEMGSSASGALGQTQRAPMSADALRLRQQMERPRASSLPGPSGGGQTAGGQTLSSPTGPKSPGGGRKRKLTATQQLRQQLQQQQQQQEQQRQLQQQAQQGSLSGANASGGSGTAAPQGSQSQASQSGAAGNGMHSMGGLPQLHGIPLGTELGTEANVLQEMEACFGDKANALDDNVDSFLSEAAKDAEPLGEPMLFGGSGTGDADGASGSQGTKQAVSAMGAEAKGGFSFVEYGCLRASANKVVCCHFSPNGKLLASAGHDKKAVLWDMDTMLMKCTMEEHSLLITDVRFNPSSTRFATSSFDKSVRVWDATDNAAYSSGPPHSVRVFTGHSTSVVSLDFHPTEEDLLCSCDADGEIRYWSVAREVCTRAFKGATTQVRFQPVSGRLLAAAADSVVSIFDVQSEACLRTLEQRHSKPVQSLCWDTTGEFMASVSEDAVRVYALGRGSAGECVHELVSSGSKFHSCTFHPKYPSLLVIGCYQSLELWNMVENKSMLVQGAHEGLIADLAHSTVRGLVASASHDKCVKLWQ